jgi:hypothetical protein
MAQEFKRLEDVKKSDVEYQKKIEYKMISLEEEESDMALFEVQKMKDETIKALQMKILQLEDQ